MTQGNEHQAKRRRWPLWFGFGAAVAAFLILVPVLAIQATDDSGGDSDLPAKPADFIGLGWSADSAAHKLDADAYLTGPHFTVVFSALEISDTAGIDYRAADGHEFLELAPGSPVTYDPPAGVTARIVVAGRAHAVDLTEMTARGLVVSVQKGHTATLLVTDEGRTQSIDLRKGRRGADAIPGYYPSVTLSWQDGDYSELGAASPDGCRRRTRLSLSFSPNESAVLPWGPELGWAKPGRAWLPVSYLPMITPITFPDYDSVNEMPPSCATDLNFTWDIARSVGLQTGDGELTPVAGTGADHTLVFDVPVSLKSATLLVHPVGTYDGEGQSHPATWSEAPPTGQIAMTAE
jgi:hypothetical protein